MTETWTPDDNLIDAARAGKLSAHTLTPHDRCWVVAGLTAAGVTAERTAELLGCSLRLVRSIRAEPMTLVATYVAGWRREVEALKVSARVDARAARLEVEDHRLTAERYRAQRDDLLDAIETQGRVETFRCGHPRVRYNIYEYRGERRCRECRARHQADHRNRNSVRITPQVEGSLALESTVPQPIPDTAGE